MKKKLLLLLALCFALTACSSKMSGEKIEVKDISEYNPEDDKMEIAEVGETAPDIKIMRLDETEGTLSDYYGKPTVIMFWATWCGYCMDEIPALQMLKDKYGEDINILAMNSGDVTEDIEDFIDETGYTFDIAVTTYGDTLKFNAQSMPVIAILDKDGVVQYYKKGGAEAEALFNDEFVPLIDELLQ